MMVLKGGEVGNQSRTIDTRNLKAVFSQNIPNPVSFLETLVHEAIELSASDLLFEPRKNGLRIRARIDGVLYELGKIKLEVYDQVAARIKVLGKLDTTEKRKVQEGQFTIEHQGRVVNLRIEIAQTVHGELIVVRIHERRTIVMQLSELGFSEVAYTTYQEMLRQQGGLIVVSGPTGCGKTTTLYSTISKLNESQDQNVMTIEDPVEFYLEGVNQMQTQEEMKFTFAAGLRTILRLSPDIILVGEIRDQETAKIAVESGLTGHLVLTTTHAEDSVGALFRLLDLGIETFLLNSALVGVVAQRLVRKNCQACKTPYKPTGDEVDLFKNILGRPPRQLMKGRGCPECQGLTYRGRVGVFEVLKVSARTRDLLRNKINEDELRGLLTKEGLVTLLRDGLEKCEQGLTTIEEILRNSLKIQ
jgi:type II secretory ATPase GspE/PulE/Tfp pilus assembly ATPase PilB-like protein